MKLKRGLIGAVITAFLFLSAASYAADLTISVNAAAPIRTIPENIFGWSMYAWFGYENGYNTTYNNIMKAGSYKNIRWSGGSWGDAYLWSDMEGPNGANGWIINYNEELYTLGLLGATMQPIVNFPGWWYNFLQDDTPSDNNNQNYAIAHTNAVNAAAAWVTNQTARNPCAQYWEIGNEVYGNWEAGWFSGLDGTYYGDKFADFYIAMKAVNPNIKIGAVAREYDNQYTNWTRNLLTAAYAKGVVPDFLSIHMYPGTNSGASYNPTLMTFDIGEIANFTTSLNSMITTAIGPSYVGHIEYCMTEWDAGGTTDYPRNRKYAGGMFVAEYLMEMAKNGWAGSNLFGDFFYVGTMAQPYPDYYVFPKWYVYPLFINRFGRDMVTASTNNSSIKAYASTDANDDLTLFIVNNSPVTDLTAQVEVSGFSAGSGGQMWRMEPAGAMPGNGNVQDSNDIKINGVLHPEPATINDFASLVTPTGSIFTLTLPKSCMILLKVPAGTSNAVPPEAPTGLTAMGKAGLVTLNWNDNSESDFAGYNIYRSTTSGSGYVKLNTTLLIATDYNDSIIGGITYYYVVTAVDTYSNESFASTEVSATPSVLNQTVYSYSGINAANTNYNSYYCDVDQFPFGNNSANRNSFVEATDSQYTYIAANDTSEWATSNPGSGDEVFMWNEMKINESPGNIIRIDLTFNGYTTNTSGAVIHQIYVLTADANWVVDTNWTKLGDDQSITPGSYATMTRSITSDFSKYINASGKIVWGVYETTSNQVMHVNYLAASVYSSGAAAPAAPVNLTATAGFQMITLDWNDSNESDFAGYNIYRSTASGFGYNKLNSSLLTDSNYIDVNVVGKPYYYVVTAVDINENQSNYSNQVSATPEVYHNCADVREAGFGYLSDINGDCHVDFYDMETVAFYWLSADCASVANCDGADFAPMDNTVSLYDFSILAQQWRQCNDPQDSHCVPNW